MGWLKCTNNCVYLVTWLAVYFLIPILGKVSLILKVQFYFLIVCWHFFSPHFLSLLVFFSLVLFSFLLWKAACWTVTRKGKWRVILLELHHVQCYSALAWTAVQAVVWYALEAIPTTPELPQMRKSCSRAVVCVMCWLALEMYWIYSPVSQIEDITGYPRKKKDMPPSSVKLCLSFHLIVLLFNFCFLILLFVFQFADMSSSNSSSSNNSKKKQEEKHLKILRDFLSLPCNKTCFDCNQRGPTYVNTTIGSFTCISCSGKL